MRVKTISVTFEQADNPLIEIEREGFEEPRIFGGSRIVFTSFEDQKWTPVLLKIIQDMHTRGDLVITRTFWEMPCSRPNAVNTTSFTVIYEPAPAALTVKAEEYVEKVEEFGKARQKALGKNQDIFSFVAGAMVVFAMLDRMDLVPARWVLAGFGNRDPFTFLHQ